MLLYLSETKWKMHCHESNAISNKLRTTEMRKLFFEMMLCLFEKGLSSIFHLSFLIPFKSRPRFFENVLILYYNFCSNPVTIDFSN